MRKALTYLGISMGLSFAFAVTYVVVMTLSLPKTDLAHGQAPFQDPLVLPIMSLIAGASGLVAWPIFTLLAGRSSPAKVTTVAGVTTLTFIVVATPISSSLGWFGSYIVCIAALLYCWCTFQNTASQPDAPPNSRPPSQFPPSPEVQTPDSQRTPSSGGCL